MDKLTPDVVSTPSEITEAQTDKLAMGAKGVVEISQGLRGFALRRSPQSWGQNTWLV